MAMKKKEEESIEFDNKSRWIVDNNNQKSLVKGDFGWTSAKGRGESLCYQKPMHF